MSTPPLPPTSPLPNGSEDELLQVIQAGLKALKPPLAPAHARALTQQVQQVIALALAPAQKHTLLELYFTHAQQIGQQLRVELPQHPTPLAPKLRQSVSDTIALLDLLSQGFFQTAHDERFSALSLGTALHLLCNALTCLHCALHLCDLLGTAAPSGLWLSSKRIYLISETRQAAPPHAEVYRTLIRQIFHEMLLWSAADPTAFNAREQTLLSAHVTPLAKTLTLQSGQSMDNASFWIDLSDDTPAQAHVRRPVRPNRPVRTFSGQTLAQNLATAPSQVPQPTGRPTLRDPGSANLLGRLQQRWAQPAKRRFPRRHQAYRVHLDCGLPRLWQILSQPNPAPGSLWMVSNESPEGFALMHLNGPQDTLMVGQLALVSRTGDDGTPPTRILCVIRRMSSDNPEHLECGLQVLSARVQAIRLRHSEARPIVTVDALFLPEMPALQHPAQIIIEADKPEALPEGLWQVYAPAQTGLPATLQLTQLLAQYQKALAFSVPAAATTLPPASHQTEPPPN